MAEKSDPGVCAKTWRQLLFYLQTYSVAEGLLSPLPVFHSNGLLRVCACTVRPSRWKPTAARATRYRGTGLRLMTHGDVFQPPVIATQHPTNSKVYWQSYSSFVSANFSKQHPVVPALFSRTRCSCQRTPSRGGSSRGGMSVAGPCGSPAKGPAANHAGQRILSSLAEADWRRAPPRQLGHQCALGGRGRGDCAGETEARRELSAGGEGEQRSPVLVAGAFFALRCVGLGVSPPPLPPAL